jgi:hypothetical protein
MVRVRLFTALSSALLIVGGTLSIAAAPANAATRSPIVRGGTTLVSVSSPQPDSPDPNTQPVSFTMTGDTTAAGTDNAGDPCYNSYFQYNNKNIFDVTLFWFRMNTSWCENGEIVTSHNTTLHSGVDLTGEVGGWEHIGNSSITFHCYIAYGSTRSCSGNFESANGYFYNTVVGESCHDHIYEEENYKGEFFANGSTTC